MKPIRVLYCVYVPPGKIRTLLDAIRLIANPATKHPAHITVRGPYSDYRDPRTWSNTVQGQRVHVGGIGTFFGPSQNTVLVKVESPAIKALWHKPDYPEYSPHLTIYDGDSRVFAEALRDILESRDPKFTFHATGMEPMVSGNGRHPLRHFFNPEDVAPLLGQSISVAEIDAADESTRLAWITALAELLAPHACTR